MGWLRIVAGELKGRRVFAPDVAGLRPTGNKAREALFSILGARVSGAEILDAYAGSGALGLEALSRGARSVTFVEADRRVLGALRSNVRDLDVEDRARVVSGRTEMLLRQGRLPGPFDLAFADPPWEGDAGPGFLIALDEAGACPTGTVVLERDAKRASADDIGAWRRVRTARYGRTCFDFYARTAVGRRVVD